MDFGARNYDASIGRWMSLDPLAEEFISYTPYNGMMNNPLSFIDPDGRFSTNVTENEDGTYTVTGGDAYDGDNGIYLDDGNGGKGDLVGYSATPESFYFSETEKTSGDGTGQFLGTIDPNDSSGKDFLNNLIKENPSLAKYLPNAVGGEKYDFKATNGTDEVQFTKNEDKYRGMPILGDKNGKPIFASARDVGNIGAGLVAGRAGVGWSTARLAFDGLESYQQGGFSSESSSTQFGQKLGHRIGSQMFLKNQASRLPGNGHLRNTTISKDIVKRKDL